MDLQLQLVTVKLPKNPRHDPKNKVTGICPVGFDHVCTDMTGEHHTIVVTSAAALRELSKSVHVTRVETVNIDMSLYSSVYIPTVTREE